MLREGCSFGIWLYLHLVFCSYCISHFYFYFSLSVSSFHVSMCLCVHTQYVTDNKQLRNLSCAYLLVIISDQHKVKVICSLGRSIDHNVKYGICHPTHHYFSEDFLKIQKHISDPLIQHKMVDMSIWALVSPSAD